MNQSFPHCCVKLLFISTFYNEVVEDSFSNGCRTLRIDPLTIIRFNNEMPHWFGIEDTLLEEMNLMFENQFNQESRDVAPSVECPHLLSQEAVTLQLPSRRPASRVSSFPQTTTRWLTNRLVSTVFPTCFRFRPGSPDSVAHPWHPSHSPQLRCIQACQGLRTHSYSVGDYTFPAQAISCLAEGRLIETANKTQRLETCCPRLKWRWYRGN
jgi:hypothetical protein